MPSIFSRQAMFQHRSPRSRKRSMKNRDLEEQDMHNSGRESKNLGETELQHEESESAIRKDSSQTQSSWGSRSRTSPIPIYPTREPRDQWSPRKNMSTEYVVLMDPAIAHGIHHIPELPSLSSQEQLHPNSFNEEGEESSQSECYDSIIGRRLYPCTYPEASAFTHNSSCTLDSNARRGAGECNRDMKRGRSRSHNVAPRETCNLGIPCSQDFQTAGESFAVRSNLFHSLHSYDEMLHKEEQQQHH